MKLIKYPNPILTQVSTECTEADLAAIKEAYPEMVKIMQFYKAAGIAAVQTGDLKRYCLVANQSDENKPHIIINPKIEEGSDLENKEEGCLSLPLFNINVDRYNFVTVSYKDENWTNKLAAFAGIEAQCIAHEIDHMNGKLLTDDVSYQKKDMWQRKAKKKNLL